MQKEKLIEKITEICIDANPEIGVRNTSMLLKGEFTGIINHKNTNMNLGDILYVIYKKCIDDLKHSDIYYKKAMLLLTVTSESKWSLGKTLDEQSLPTLELINEII